MIEQTVKLRLINETIFSQSFISFIKELFVLPCSTDFISETYGHTQKKIKEICYKAILFHIHLTKQRLYYIYLVTKVLCLMHSS